MRNSDLLDYIIKRCNEGYEIVTFNTFFTETMSVIRGDTAKISMEGFEPEKYTEELAELKKTVDNEKITIRETLHNIFGYLSENTERFIDSLSFDRLMAQLAYENGEDGVLTANTVFCRVLKEATPAITKCIVRDGQPKEAVTSPDQTEGQAKASEDSAEKFRALRKKFTSPDAQVPPAAKAQSSEEEGDSILALFEDDDDEYEDDEDDEEEVVKSEKKGHLITELMRHVNKIRSNLAEKVFGQDHAIASFVSGYFQAEIISGVNNQKEKPKATFLFAGPPGVGKTYLAEMVAESLGLPFRCFDMSGYSEKEATQEFAGIDKSYKASKPGNVTGFVADNPYCVLLFDEIEKAHITVINLFLQILDAGRLADKYMDEDVSFKNAIIIFTTNAGRRMYEDESINLVTAPKKVILKALSEEVSPITNSPTFPPAICSRFASGNVVMFNRLSADHLLKICEREVAKQCALVKQKTGVKLTCDKMVPYALLFSEGGKADGRVITARSIKFVHNELYELLRLMRSESGINLEDLKSVTIKLAATDDPEISSLFAKGKVGSVLVFANKAKCNALASKVNSVNVFAATTVEQAKEILDSQEISVVLCDLSYKVKNKDNSILNIEDIDSYGKEFFEYVTTYTNIPVYLIDSHGDSFSVEEIESLSCLGARGVVDLSWSGEKLNELIQENANAAYLRDSMLELAKANKILSFGTAQSIDKKGENAVISLYGFKLITAIDASDNEGILSGVSKPDVHFSDVIGANDAKDELSYFINYLKDPAKYVKQGIKAPKGILLYGPPGTGKTMLAKAMAGESNVTFIKAEGNQFLKRLVGEGPESVHRLFSIARKYAPSILFIDEIDAVAKNRQSESSASEASGDILTSFLTEMDGFNTDSTRPVFVLAATNFGVEQNGPRSLDPAFLRRFDRRIYVDLPSREERTQFINLRVSKLKNHTISKEQIENLALRSTGSSLAELDSVFELALRNVIKAKDGILTDEVLEEAYETFNSGEVKKWNKDELLRTARHEAGHAVVCWATGEKPSYLTIVARGSHGGYMQHGDSESKGLYTKKDILGRVKTSLGGRAAELVYYGEEGGLSSGASGDLQTATQLVQAMICNYGMDEELGLGFIGINQIMGTPFYADLIKRINKILGEQLAATKAIIAGNKTAIDCLVEQLMAKNSLKAEDIEEVLSKHFKGVKGGI